MNSLLLFFFITVLPATAAPVGKVFRRIDNRVEIMGPGITAFKAGTILVVAGRHGNVPVQIRRTFHTKVDATILKVPANVATGNPVYLKGDEPVENMPMDKPLVEAAPASQVFSTGVEFLSPGWDVFNGRGKRVQASYSVMGADNVPTKLRFEFNFTGAERSHEYTMGIYVFGDLPATKPGYAVGNPGVIEREDFQAKVAERDFGTLVTDESGNGSALFEYDLPSGNLSFQFAVRAGACKPVKKNAPECGVIFRSGGKFGLRLIHIKPP